MDGCNSTTNGTWSNTIFQAIGKMTIFVVDWSDEGRGKQMRPHHSCQLSSFLLHFVGMPFNCSSPTCLWYGCLLFGYLPVHKNEYSWRELFGKQRVRRPVFCIQEVFAEPCTRGGILPLTKQHMRHLKRVTRDTWALTVGLGHYVHSLVKSKFTLKW